MSDSGPNVPPRPSATFPVLLATWFGCGFFPWGPGTVGTLAATLIAGALSHYWNLGRPFFLVLTLLMLWPAIWSATQTARLYRREDPGLVVIDEVLGLWVTLLGAALRDWRVFGVAFVLFRVFDIWKPWPVRKLERLPEGVGIVADDLAAGLYGALFLYLGSRMNLY